MIINGYNIDESKTIGCSSGVRYYAEKDGKVYSIKKLDEPRRPTPRMSDAARTLWNTECDNFEREHECLVKDLRPFLGSNIIVPIEYFLDGIYYYEVSEFVNIERMSLAQIASLSESQKLLILKTAAANFSNIHSLNIMHLDVKPDNLPISMVPKTKNIVCTLMDFTSTHYQGMLPKQEKTDTTPPYMSPELAAYKESKSIYGGERGITVKSDVFSLALVFHEYWSGRKFIFDSSDLVGESRPLYNAVAEGLPICVANNVPDWLDALLKWMIALNPSDRPTMAQVLEGLKDHSKIKGFLSTPTFEVVDISSADPEKYVKGIGWNDDFVSFKVKGSNVIFTYKSGATTNISISTAINRGYITKV